MSVLELDAFKKQVMVDIATNELPIYNFPIDEDEDDQDIIDESNELRSLLPFSVVGSDQEILVNGRRVRCRQYPWGVVEGFFILI